MSINWINSSSGGRHVKTGSRKPGEWKLCRCVVDVNTILTFKWRLDIFMDGERVEGSWWKKKKSQAMASVGRRKLLDSALCIRLVGQGCCGAAARCIPSKGGAGGLSLWGRKHLALPRCVGLLCLSGEQWAINRRETIPFRARCAGNRARGNTKIE